MTIQNRRRYTAPPVVIVTPPGGDPPTSGTPTGPAASGTTATFAPAAIPISSPEIQNPFRGLINWDEACTNWGTGALDTQYVNQGLCPVPESGAAQPLINVYGRDQDWCTWRKIEPSPGVYNFDGIEARAAAAHAIGGQYGFRIMTYGSGASGWGITHGNNIMPQWMQDNPGTYGGSGSGSGYVPNTNNGNYLNKVEALWTAIGNRFGAGRSGGPDPRFGMMDIGMYGPAGEWWTGGNEPGGAITYASGKRIVDAHINNMPQCQFLALPGDSQSGTTQILQYCMATKTPLGLWIGIRGDSIGCVPHWYTTLNLPYWSSSQAPTQWQRAPLFGEPGNFETNGTTWQSRGDGSGRTSCWTDTKAQVIDSHVSMVGNGNVGLSIGNYSAANQQGWKDSGKYAGFRYQLRNVSLPNRIEASSHATIRAEWINVGVAPAYRDWRVKWVLKNTAGTVVWTGTSTMNFNKVLPSTTTGVVSENFNFPADLQAGNMSLCVRVDDPTGYFKPLNLPLNGRQADGSYPVGTIVTA